jgi:class 3 adenylate cyclase/pimeloyl-ACP methyl ester carboxylesterase
MEPQIRYARTSDGASIAYSARGAGPPLVATITSWESMRWDGDDALGRAYYDELARQFHLVRYDRRGVGLSDRNRNDFSLELEVGDLDAVVDAAGLRRFALLGQFHMGPVAIEYAATHPDRVSHLVLYGTYARGADLTRTEVKESLTAMMRSHWGIASRTLVDLVSPGVPGDVLDHMAERTRQSVSGETAASILRAAYETDVTSRLPSLRMPTIVIHRDRDRAVRFELGRSLAAQIPDATFIGLEGRVHWPWVGDVAAITGAIESFAGSQPPARDEAAGTRAASGTAVILFTDIAQSTALTERLGDDAFRAAARELDGRLRAAIRDANGTPIEGKRLGDGLLATFSSARDALAAARRCVELSAESELRLHVGLHAGDITREGGDVYGGAVNIASRICDLCEPGEVLVSQTVRDLARTSAGVSFDDRGEHELKGITDPVRVFAVREGG